MLISICIAYYFDYKSDKKYFKRSVLDVLLLIVIILGIILFNEVFAECWNYIFKK